MFLAQCDWSLGWKPMVKKQKLNNDMFKWSCPKHVTKVKAPFEIEREGNLYVITNRWTVLARKPSSDVCRLADFTYKRLYSLWQKTTDKHYWYWYFLHTTHTIAWIQQVLHIQCPKSELSISAGSTKHHRFVEKHILTVPVVSILPFQLLTER